MSTESFLTQKKPIRVAIVEDDFEVRQEHALILQENGLHCVNTYPDAESAIAGIPSDKADVVLVDIQLPGLSGVECVRQLKNLCPSVQFLMLTVYEDEDKIFRSLVAGAAGYLLKRASHEHLLHGIEEVFRGGAPMTGAIARKVVQHFHQQPRRSDLEKLTARELQVLELLARGNLYKEIARKLGVEIDTVSKHVRNIYSKLQVHSRTEAAVKFFGR